MNKIEKFLRQLDRPESLRVQKCLEKIVGGKWGALDIKKLKGYANVYRVRVGAIRIIFFSQGNAVHVVLIERRNENTYRKR